MLFCAIIKSIFSVAAFYDLMKKLFLRRKTKSAEEEKIDKRSTDRTISWLLQIPLKNSEFPGKYFSPQTTNQTFNRLELEDLQVNALNVL